MAEPEEREEEGHCAGWGIIELELELEVMAGGLVTYGVVSSLEEL